MTDSLEIGEVHPAAHSAYKFVKENMMEWLEPIASCALSGNRDAEICHGTMSRILNNEPVSDRYILGLAWYLLELIKNAGAS